MKYGVLRYSYSNNIGDEMQTIAAEQFLPQVDVTVERDRLHWYKNEAPIKVPFNGWFTRPAFPACWPPPPSIRPIFVSWYAVLPEVLINEHTAGYFKQYEPIGCRSLPTIKSFENVGVSAYHSGCLTLTLPEMHAERTDDIYIVDADPSLVKKMIPASVRARTKHLSHLTPTGQLRSGSGWSALDFYLKAWNRADRNMTCMRQHRERLLVRRHDKRMAMARERLATYARAKLVITGLLHCSMPCLALGTPVVLLKPDLDENPRFDGLQELVRHRSSGKASLDIDWERPAPNNDAYKVIAGNLSQTMRAALA